MPSLSGDSCRRLSGQGNGPRYDLKGRRKGGNMIGRIGRKALSKGIAWGWALAVGAFYASASLAQGGTRNEVVFSRAMGPHERLRAEFQVDRELGRAWVAVELRWLTPDGYPWGGQTLDIPSAVDGLYYDKSTKQLVYQSGKVRVVCAEDWTLLWHTALKETGQCPLRVSSQTRTLYDGFNRRDETVGEVVLQLPAAALPSRSERR